jgi:uncharacterized phage infection (PIP) family protein YhgE
MANETELQAWIDSLTLSEDEKKVFSAVMQDEKRGKVLKDSVLMKSDYSRKMNELQNQQQNLQAEIQKNQQELASHEQNLVNWKGTADKTLAEIQKERDAAVLKLATVQQRAKTLSENYGIDPKEILPDDIQPTPATQPRTEDGRFVAKDEFQKAVTDVMQFPQVAAELIDISAEHQELFGKNLKGTRKLVEDAVAHKRTIRDEWAEQFKVADRRAEVEASAKAAEEARIRTDERNKVLSEVKIPIPRAQPDVSPLFRTNLPKSAERPATDTQSSQRIVDAALQAYQTGKYREPTPNP